MIIGQFFPVDSKFFQNPGDLFMRFERALPHLMVLAVLIQFLQDLQFCEGWALESPAKDQSL